MLFLSETYLFYRNLLQSIGDFAAMNAVYAEFFTSEMPARMCYQVAALPMGALVEIDAVAVK